ncbi:maleylpyruvate isomerase family mycothiol-dependent enzyme [Streptosporangium sp. CA-115845]|uniref:maleylpyruvate isomerase family mycothiol-dependent enzyme n=1 Tax=Streptosporangium sp. CA-115845 TaxID=3240071 RepID=UPI003D8A5C18
MTGGDTARIRSLEWMERGTDLLAGALDRLADADLDGTTPLPGWSRRHLVAHLGFNAAALRRLASWARTGEPNPMYASPEQRAAEIAEGASWPAGRLRDLVSKHSAGLLADLAALDDRQWGAPVVTAQGRTVPASEIPWLRVREVAVHAVDLDAGVAFADLPVDLCEELLSDVAARRSVKGDDPALSLVSATGRTWSVDGPGTPVRVGGEPGELARWLTGRGAGTLTDEHGAPPPALTAWL